MKCESGKVGNRGWWRAVVAGLAGVALLCGLFVVSAPAADTWFDDWSDGTDVNPPLDWEKSQLFPGLYDASSGNYVLAGLDVQEPIGISNNDDEILSAIAGAGDAFQTFSGEVSVRARARIDRAEGQHGSVGVAAFSPTGETLATNPSAYAVTIHDTGETEINAFSLQIGIIHMNDADLRPNPDTDPPMDLTDLYVQFDNVITPDSNATMSITVWQPGETQPAPQSSVDVSTVVDPDTGITGQQILQLVPTTGASGIVFNEDPSDGGAKPEGASTFFWAMSSSVTLTNGDMNLDGSINGLDVAPFVALVTAGTFDPLADMNSDGAVNGLDVAPFVDAVVAGGVAAQGVPEPSTLLLTILGLVACASFGARRRS